MGSPFAYVLLLLHLDRAADDLMPLVAYVLAQSHYLWLYSDIQHTSEFIDEEQSLGQFGYVLTSVQVGSLLYRLITLLLVINHVTLRGVSLS